MSGITEQPWPKHHSRPPRLHSSPQSPGDAAARRLALAARGGDRKAEPAKGCPFSSFSDQPEGGRLSGRRRGNRMGHNLPMVFKLQADIALGPRWADNGMNGAKEVYDPVAGRLARKEQPDVISFAQCR